MATAVATPRLTAKQEHYCQLRALNGLGQYEAFKLAYETETKHRATVDSNAYKLEHDTEIARRIKTLQEALQEQLIKDAALTKEYVLKQLHDNALKASQAVPVRDHEGNETGEYTYYPAAVNKSYELIGTELGMFKGARGDINVYGDVYISQVTNQLTLLMAEADARFPGLLDWYQERLKALGAGQGKP